MSRVFGGCSPQESLIAKVNAVESPGMAQAHDEQSMSRQESVQAESQNLEHQHFFDEATQQDQGQKHKLPCSNFKATSGESQTVLSQGTPIDEWLGEDAPLTSKEGFWKSTLAEDEPTNPNSSLQESSKIPNTPKEKLLGRKEFSGFTHPPIYQEPSDSMELRDSAGEAVAHTNGSGSQVNTRRPHNYSATPLDMYTTIPIRAIPPHPSNRQRASEVSGALFTDPVTGKKRKRLLMDDMPGNHAKRWRNMSHEERIKIEGYEDGDSDLELPQFQRRRNRRLKKKNDSLKSQTAMVEESSIGQRARRLKERNEKKKQAAHKH